MSDRIKIIRTAGAEERLARLDAAIATGRPVTSTVDQVGMRILLTAYVDLGRLRDDPEFGALRETVHVQGRAPDAVAWPKLYRLIEGVDHPETGAEKRLRIVKP